MWSNSMKPKGLYEEFDHIPTRIYIPLETLTRVPLKVQNTPVKSLNKLWSWPLTNDLKKGFPIENISGIPPGSQWNQLGSHWKSGIRWDFIFHGDPSSLRLGFYWDICKRLGFLKNPTAVKIVLIYDFNVELNKYAFVFKRSGLHLRGMNFSISN
jgi:hypothetical protein